MPVSVRVTACDGNGESGLDLSLSLVVSRYKITITITEAQITSPPEWKSLEKMDAITIRDDGKRRNDGRVIRCKDA